MYTQEAEAKIAMIKKLLMRIKFEVEMRLVKEYENEIGLYYHQPIKHLIKECDMAARKTREEINEWENNDNIKFYRYYSLHKNGTVQSRSIQEAIRITDTQEVEHKYVKKKFGYKKDFIDIEARNIF